MGCTTWGEAYIDSIDECRNDQSAVPQWYGVVEFAPKSGQSDVLQGKLLKEIEKLRCEAQDNETQFILQDKNLNFERRYL